MTPEIYQYLAVILAPAILGMATFIMKSILNRLEIVEQNLKDTLTTSEVRQLLDDKLDPIKDDMGEIKQNLDKLFNLYVKELKERNDK